MKYLRNLKGHQLMNLFMVLAITVLAFMPLVSNNVVHAQSSLDFGSDDIFGGLEDELPEQLADPGESGPAEIIRDILNIVLSVVGLIALIMLIVGGFRYMTAGGDDEKVGAAKSTIVNALIGLVLVILSYAIVSIVYNFINTDA